MELRALTEGFGFYGLGVVVSQLFGEYVIIGRLAC